MFKYYYSLHEKNNLVFNHQSIQIHSLSFSQSVIIIYPQTSTQATYAAEMLERRL